MEDSRRFRIRYQLKLADLRRGRLVCSRSERGTWLSDSADLTVVLADLYDRFRTLPVLQGIEILTIRPAPQP